MRMGDTTTMYPLGGVTFGDVYTEFKAKTVLRMRGG